MNINTEILLLSAALQVNETQYVDCPSCGKLRKMGITRNNEGLLFNCFAGSCPERGFIPDFPEEIRKSNFRKPRHRRFVGRHSPCDKSDAEWMWERFQIQPSELGMRVTEFDEYYLPIIDLKGHQVGEVIRQPWEGSPRKGRPDRPKALTYLQDKVCRLSFYHSWGRPPIGAPMIDWPGHWPKGAPLVLVEDQVSAVKVSYAAEIPAVALLGNTIDEYSLGMIKEGADPESVFIWLDPDMNAQAFSMNATWGQMFPNTRVIMSEKDPKDLTHEEIRAHLYD